jgi:hypothetical protein
MDLNSIDWSAIASKLPKMEDTRVQTSKVSDLDYWILKAAAKAKGRSMAMDSASLLSASIRRLSPEWCDLIAFAAAQEGKTFEEKFVELALDT